MTPELPARRAKIIQLLRIALVVNMAAILVTAVVFRVARLGSVPGLNADEYFCLVAFRGLIVGDKSLGWFVPTGRILDLFYAVSAYVLDLLLPRSAATIRAASVFSGFVMGAVAFPLLRSARSTFVASIVTVLAVVLPIHISYSRIGWEYSQIPLATLLVVGCALHARIWPVALALIAGMLVHPAVAYLAPLVALSIVYKLFARMKAPKLKTFAKVFGVLVLGFGVFVFLLWTTMRGLEADLRGMFAEVPGNLDATKLFSFVQLYSNMFGVGISRQNLTDYPEIVFGPWNTAFLVLNAFLYVGYFATFWRRYRKDATVGRELPVVIGLLIAMVGFYLTRGPHGITPPYERYALVLIMPSLIVLAIMAESLAVRLWLRGAVLAAVCLTSWLLLVEFKIGYFDYFENTGGKNAHITYRTNQADPKDAAYRWVRARGPAPVIFMKEWRTYWPVQYVASADRSVRVVSVSKTLWTGGMTPAEFTEFLALPGNDFIATLRGNHGYVIGFEDPTFDANLRVLLSGVQVTRKDFPDAGGLPSVSVWFIDV